MNNEKEPGSASPRRQKKNIVKPSQEVSGGASEDTLADGTRDTASDRGGEPENTISISSRQQFFSGPIPPPDALERYKSVDPDIPNRLVKMAEKQQDHSHTLERQAQKSMTEAENKGRNYALIISLLMIVCSTYLISTGNGILGTIFAGTTLLGLAYLFIAGHKKEN